MDPSFAHLDRLVALVTSAVEDVKAEYTKLNVQAPDLADVEAHPLDNMPIPDKLSAAVETIAGVCALLTMTVLPPVQALHYVSLWCFVVGSLVN